jgi:hypothetical protein
MQNEHAEINHLQQPASIGNASAALDVPRDRFLVAGDAWLQCRAGQADLSRFGIQFAGLRGLWFVAGSIVRDVAALNGAEMLPWDVWGCQPRPGEQLNSEPS